MPVPEFKADHGEPHNLGVRAGTLTKEERFTINEHIVLTMKILSALPFRNT